MNTQRLDRNAALRRRYVQVEAQLQAARAARDEFVERRCQRELRGLGEEFFARNRGLAISVAKGFIANAGDLADDYVSAALEGLWEAFLKWDPAQGTLGNFSRTFIEGQVRREVRRNEYPEISYGDFSARKEVLGVAERLTEDLGRRPSDEEVAEASGHTIGVVERVRMPQATSLDAPTGTETTRGELLADAVTGDVADVVIDDLALDYLRETTKDLSPLELFVYLRREGIGAAATQTLVELSDLTGIGREVLRRREQSARSKVDGAHDDALAAVANRLQGH